jgi:hypothetical protein
MPEGNTLETALKNQIEVMYENQSYTFKIPSIKDRIRIAGVAADLRKSADPQGNGITLGYDPTTVLFTDTVATLMVLLITTSAPWVYTIGLDGKPTIDLDKWPDTVPVMEVIDQFNKELDKFRATGNKS